jgi:hypothetical protein
MNGETVSRSDNHAFQHLLHGDDQSRRLKWQHGNLRRQVTVIAATDLTSNDTSKFSNVFGVIRGVKFEDENGNHTRDAGEPVLGGWTIFLELFSKRRVCRAGPELVRLR